MALAGPLIGTTSPTPVLDWIEKLINSNSIQLRGLLGFIAPSTLPGYTCWHTDYAKANAHTNKVKVAAAAYSSSSVTILSLNIYMIKLLAA